MNNEYYQEKSGESRVSNTLPIPNVFMPDNGCQFDAERMEELGYPLFIDTKHPQREHLTRWWFRSERSREQIIQGIISRGYVVLTK